MTTSTAGWSASRKLTFRYLSVFFALIIFPFPLSLIIGQVTGTGFNADLWPPIVSFSGKYVFGIEEVMSHQITGSGDKLYDWVWYGTVLLLTLVAGTLFNLLDRKRDNYARLHAWLTFLLSYYLAYNLLLYGIAKLFQMQFIPLGLGQLYETYGNSSPMRLLWTFMGASKGYTFFAGLSEVIAGVLLLFRRTRTLGAILAFGVMLNVFVLNLCYDVPVKLFSFQLLLISAYLMSGEAQRLFTFFLRNEAVPARTHYPLFHSRRGRVAVLCFQIVFCLLVGASEIVRNREAQVQYGNKRPKSALYGVYDVLSFERNGELIPEGYQRKSRWQTLIFDHPDYLTIRHDDNSNAYQQVEIDTTAKIIDLGGQPVRYRLTDEVLELEGQFGTDTLNVRLTPYSLASFSLPNRGFHWVSEQPYNRYGPLR